jgi:nicotinate-nucleotide pyrophosphorylase (carboxylating)
MDVIKQALKEDIGSGDITSEALIPKKVRIKARLIAKEAGVVAGLDLVGKIFDRAEFNLLVKDGQLVKKGWVLAEIEGNARYILSRERVALNFLQRLSGIATLTRKFVEAAGNVKILDTRKTTPGLRRMEKYAVRVGGGTNHRFGLYDMVLIKDTHLKILGVKEAVAKAKKTGKKVEVEVGSLLQMEEAVAAKPDMIMLDNMSLAEMKKAVKMVNGITVEVSGGMTVEKVAQVAKLGVDYISVGGLTHSSKALDISLKVVSYEAD